MSSNQPSTYWNVAPSSEPVAPAAFAAAAPGVCEVGVAHAPSFIARMDTPHSESGVSIGPLVAGISMMVLMRRHRF